MSSLKPLGNILEQEVTRTYNLFELFYRRNGEKRSIICNSKRELLRRKRLLDKNRRKFLGYREVSLVEVAQ